MYVAAYFVGLACGVVLLLPILRRMRSARASCAGSIDRRPRVVKRR